MPVYYSATSSFDNLYTSSSLFVSSSCFVTGTLDISGSMNISSQGLKFPATFVSSSDLNTLDDYEEGTWTPSFNTNVGGSFTYGTQVGTYTKVGNRVTVSFNVTLTNGTYGSQGSTTGLTVGNLPFAARNITNVNWFSELIYGTNTAASTSVAIYGQTTAAASIISLYRLTAATNNPFATTLVQNVMGTTGFIRGSLTYLTA